ncbi:MAG: hypothetical protein HYV09_30835 [Deltaproteobacteria bacterium]|nr:hypothetical protein [Deltaproteobacteria bacterium]
MGRAHAPVLSLVLLASTACSRPLPDTATAAPEAVAWKTPADAGPKVEILFRLDADLGSGTEAVTLAADGTLRVGAASVRLELARNEYFFEQQGSLKVVDIDRATALRGILFTEPTSESEDPPNRYRLFLKVDGRLHLAFDRVLGVYGPTELTFTGSGEARYREDAWTACDRAGHPAETKAEEITLRLDALVRLTEVARTPTTKRVGTAAPSPVDHRAQRLTWRASA